MAFWSLVIAPTPRWNAWCSLPLICRTYILSSPYSTLVWGDTNGLASFHARHSSHKHYTDRHLMQSPWGSTAFDCLHPDLWNRHSQTSMTNWWIKAPKPMNTGRNSPMNLGFLLIGLDPFVDEMNAVPLAHFIFGKHFFPSATVIHPNTK